MAYLEMWIRYCKENSIWFAVCANGIVDQVTDTTYDETVELDGRCIFGSKQAYEWLIRWHTKLKTEIVQEKTGTETGEKGADNDRRR